MTSRRRPGVAYAVSGEAHVIQYTDAYMAYGVFLEELPWSGTPPTALSIGGVDHLADEVNTAPAQAGQWRIHYAGQKAGFVECHEGDDGLTLVIDYTAQGANPLSELYGFSEGAAAQQVLAFDGFDWVPVTLSSLFDQVFGTGVGKVIKRGTSVWELGDDLGSAGGTPSFRFVDAVTEGVAAAEANRDGEVGGANASARSLAGGLAGMGVAERGQDAALTGMVFERSQNVQLTGTAMTSERAQDTAATGVSSATRDQDTAVTGDPPPVATRIQSTEVTGSANAFTNGDFEDITGLSPPDSGAPPAWTQADTGSPTHYVQAGGVAPGSYELYQRSDGASGSQIAQCHQTISMGAAERAAAVNFNFEIDVTSNSSASPNKSTSVLRIEFKTSGGTVNELIVLYILWGANQWGSIGSPYSVHTGGEVSRGVGYQNKAIDLEALYEAHKADGASGGTVPWSSIDGLRVNIQSNCGNNATGQVIEQKVDNFSLAG